MLHLHALRPDRTFIHTRLQHHLTGHYHEKAKQLAFLCRLLIHPAQKIHEQQKLLQQILEKINKIIHKLIEVKKSRLDYTTVLIEKQDPEQKIIFLRQRTNAFFNRLNQAFEKGLTAKKSQFGLAIKKIETLSPINTLQRGYAILYTDKNKVLSDVNSVENGKKIFAQLTNGKLICKVEKIIK